MDTLTGVQGLGDLRVQVQQRIAKTPGVFFDEEKRVMISVEKRHELQDALPDVVEQGFAEARQFLQGIMREHGDLEFHETTYALDLTPGGLSKKSGALRALAQYPRHPSFVTMIGDAPSDLLLADGVAALHLPYEMYFVGNPATLTPAQKEKYRPTFPARLYDEGTLEVLRNLLAQSAA